MGSPSEDRCSSTALLTGDTAGPGAPGGLQGPPGGSEGLLVKLYTQFIFASRSCFHTDSDQCVVHNSCVKIKSAPAGGTWSMFWSESSRDKPLKDFWTKQSWEGGCVSLERLSCSRVMVSVCGRSSPVCSPVFQGSGPSTEALKTQTRQVWHHFTCEAHRTHQNHFSCF